MPVDIRAQQARVHAAEILHEVHEAEPRLNAQHQGALAQLEIEVHQERLLFRGPVDKDRQIGGQRCGAASAFGTEEREDPPRFQRLTGLGFPELVSCAGGRRLKCFGGYRLG
jgi:hypothetical protein